MRTGISVSGAADVSTLYARVGPMDKVIGDS